MCAVIENTSLIINYQYNNKMSMKKMLLDFENITRIKIDQKSNWSNLAQR